MMRTAMVAVMVASLTGCATAPVETASGQAGACDAGAVQDVVGKPADAVVAEAQRRSGARALRRYTTGDMLTMDLRQDRLNVETDANGIVVKVSCG